jgi:hypothetical protein
VEQVIWIEVLSRHRDVAVRHRLTGSEIHIGRGYNNDVVLDDPFVAPRHLRIYRDEEGHLVAANLGSANGLFPAGSSQSVEQVRLDGDHPIRIGRTLLRIRESGFVVAPERVIVRVTRRWPLALALGFAALSIEILFHWLRDFSEPRVTQYALPPLYVALFVFGWAGLWSISSRIFAGQARFERNLLIATAGILSYTVYDALLPMVSFAFSWEGLTAYQYVGLWLLAAILVYCHLDGMVAARPVWRGGAVAALAVTAIAIQALSSGDLGVAASPQMFRRQLLPPSIRIAAPKSEDAFVAEIDGLRAKLDHDRTEMPPSVGAQGSDSD